MHWIVSVRTDDRDAAGSGHLVHEGSVNTRLYAALALLFLATPATHEQIARHGGHPTGRLGRFRRDEGRR